MLNNKMDASLKVLFSMKKYIKINKKSIAVLDKIGSICNKKNIEKEKTETLCKAVA